MHQLHLCRGAWLPQRVSWYDTKQSDGDARALGNAEHPFIAIASRSTLARNDSAW